MAFQTSLIQFSGRVGNLVGRKLPDGGYSLSAYQPRVHNPRTTRQTVNRARMSVATKLASRLGWVMQEAKLASGEKAYAHNRLLGLIKHALSDSNCTGIFPSDLPLIKRPAVKAQFSVLTLTRHDSLVTLHAELVPEQASRIFRSTAAIIAYNQTRNLWQSISLPHEGLPDTTLRLPDYWQNDDIQLAAYLLLSLRNDPAPAAAANATSSQLSILNSQFSITQVSCVFNMPENPVPIPNIYKKHKRPQGQKTTTSDTPAQVCTIFSPNSDTPASYLQPNSDTPPSLYPSSAPPS